LHNLASALHSEIRESTEMYPAMAKVAREEGFNDVADWFETLAKAEHSHAQRYARALETLKQD
jgi:rubrerythrin